MFKRRIYLYALFLLIWIHKSFSFTTDSNFGTLPEEIVSSVKLTIEIYEYEAKLIVPQEIDPDIRIRIGAGYDIPVHIYLDYKTPTTQLQDFRLAISSPGTSLIVVKIPPPDPGTRQEKFKSPSFFWETKYIDGCRIQPGVHSLGFRLEKCKNDKDCNDSNLIVPPEDIIDQDQSDFEIYQIVDIGFNNVDWFVGDNHEEVTFEYSITNTISYPCPIDPYPINALSKIKFYSSLDEQLDDSDTWIETKTLNELYDDDTIIDLVIKQKLHRELANNYLICQLDADNDIEEENENNNVSSIFIPPLKDLEIQNIKVHWSKRDSGLYIICVIKNKGELNIKKSSISQLRFNHEINAQVFDNIELPPIQSNEEREIKFYIDKNDYFRYLVGNRVTVSLDVQNDIIETDEKNNEIDFFAPFIQNGQTIEVYPYNLKSPDKLIKKSTLKSKFKNDDIAYPNPFSDQINFKIEVTDPLSHIQLNIYDIRGILIDQYEVKKKFSTGKKLVLYTNAYSLINGLYYYEIKVNGELYSGTIIKE